MPLELDYWYVQEIKNKIQGFDVLNWRTAHEVRQYAKRAKAIKMADRSIRRSLTKKFKVKFI